MATIDKYSKETLSLLRKNVDVLRRTPIYEILLAEGKDVRHTRSGLYHSPFREDATPSFHVNEVKHCFSDPGDFDPSHKKEGAKQAGGDTIDLVMWLKGYSFDEALIYLYELNPSLSIEAKAPKKQPAPPSSSALSAYVNHSGGAKGADSLWGDIGAEYGVTSKHYYHGAKTPNGNVEITEEQFNEGKEHVLLANRSLHRQPDKYMDLLARNWMQVRESEAIYAISNLDPKGKLVFPDGTGYIPVAGGTGWAVQMAIDAGKTVYLFSQDEKKWYKFTGRDASLFGWTAVEGKAPALTKNFAGIGSRQLTLAGQQAILDAYKQTIAEKLSNDMDDDDYLTRVDRSKSINIWAGDNENKILSNMATRPFVVGVNQFNSVEQYFQYNKAILAGDEKTAKEILGAASSWEAKTLGRTVKNLDRENWDKVKLSIMEAGIRMSFISNPDAMDALLKTGSALLTHKQESSSWGDGFPRLLMKVRDSFQRNALDEQGEYRSTTSIEIKSIKQGITSPSLLNYETKERMIAPDVLNKYCSQVQYTVVMDSAEGDKKMTYLAVGFPNRNNDYTLRGAPYTTKSGKPSQGIKRSTGNDVTIINKEGDFLTGDAVSPSHENVVVFEGFNDFLSWLTWRGEITPVNSDVVVLNSVVNLDRSVEFLSRHKNVYAYLDADSTGRKATESLQEALKGKEDIALKDCSFLYAAKKLGDFNDAWKAEAAKRIAKGEQPIRMKSKDINDNIKIETPPQSHSKSRGLH